MTEEKRTKKQLEEKLEELVAERKELNEQIVTVSQGYQNVLSANNTLRMLVNKYEETINLLTARLLEARAQS